VSCNGESEALPNELQGRYSGAFTRRVPRFLQEAQNNGLNKARKLAPVMRGVRKTERMAGLASGTTFPPSTVIKKGSVRFSRTSWTDRGDKVQEIAALV